MVFKQHHFVFVHGAGHGAWAWVKVVAALEKVGHRATAIDLASAGDNKDLADDITSLEQYSRPLEDLFQSLSTDEKVNQLSLSNADSAVLNSDVHIRKFCLSGFWQSH